MFSCDKKEDNAHVLHKSFVCDSHFSEEFIVKYDSFLIEGKRVEIPRDRWTLKSEAVPHIFPGLPKYLSNNLKSRKSPTKRLPVFKKKETDPQLEMRTEGTEGCSRVSPQVEKCQSTADQTIAVLKRKIKRQDRNAIRLRDKVKLANARINILEKQLKDAKINAAQAELSGHSKLSKKQKLIVDTMIK